MWNVATTNQFKSHNFGGTFGAALVGIAQQLDNNAFRADDRFLYSFSLNTSLSYTLPKWETVFSAYYKYNGKTQQFIATSSEYVISDIGESHWLDATVQKKFCNGTLETTFGARNILNITNINQTRTADGAGHAASNQIMLAYGRSFFLKVTYNLNL
jgi:outer membrane receptor for ferrienterochelin and colicins